VSIYAIRTVTTPTVMPPKPTPVTLTPRMSLAEDAAAIRKRHAGASYCPPSPKAPARRIDPVEHTKIAQAGRQRAFTAYNRQMRQRILDLMTHPVTCSDLCAVIGLSRSAIAGHLGQLKREGLVTCAKVAKGREGGIWVKA
jgi:DNA-binding transcriptional ArsR family regulator